MNKVLITGSSGFIGSAVVESEAFKDVDFIKTSLRYSKIDDIIYDGIDAVFYCAGIADSEGRIGEDLFVNVNCKLPFELAQKSKLAGVKYFLYLSSVKVFGDHSKESDIENSLRLNPTDNYGRSKMMAEKALLSLRGAKFEVGIVRPCMVYGERGKGNMRSLIKLIDKGFPLPFKNVKNKRSVVYLGNLISLMNEMYRSKLSEIIIASDSKTVSTEEIVNTISVALNKKVRLFAPPVFGLKLLKKFKPLIYLKLYRSQYYPVDQDYLRLGFSPPYSFEEGMKRTIKAYKESNNVL